MAEKPIGRNPQTASYPTALYWQRIGDIPYPDVRNGQSNHGQRQPQSRQEGHYRPEDSSTQPAEALAAQGAETVGGGLEP